MDGENRDLKKRVFWSGRKCEKMRFKLCRKSEERGKASNLGREEALKSRDETDFSSCEQSLYRGRGRGESGENKHISTACTETSRYA